MFVCFAVGAGEDGGWMRGARRVVIKAVKARGLARGDAEGFVEGQVRR